MILLYASRVSGNPKDFLLFYVDRSFYLRTHVSDVNALDHN